MAANKRPPPPLSVSSFDHTFAGHAPGADHGELYLPFPPVFLPHPHRSDLIPSVEKFGRLAGDVADTRKAAVDIVELCFKDASWKMLNDQIVVLSKRRGQLKQVCSSIFLLHLQCCCITLLLF
jgi:hypothetical protein